MVGLDQVNNTSDNNKPISFATSQALAAIVSNWSNDLALKAPLDAPAFTGIVTGITPSMVGLDLVDNTSDVDKPISTAGVTKNNSQDALISNLRAVPFMSINHGLKNYAFSPLIPRILNATGAAVTVVANSSASSTIATFTVTAPEGYFLPNWSGIRYCLVLAQMNFNYISGNNDNVVNIWVHDVGTTLPGNTPTISTAVGGTFTSALVKNNVAVAYSGQFNAIVPLTGGRYYTMAMLSTSSLTYPIVCNVSVSALYGD
jgi:hypothetical protein